MRVSLTNSLTICDPVASQVEPVSSVAPDQPFRDDLFHHRHVQVDGVVQKQRVDRTLYTRQLVHWTSRAVDAI